MHNNQIEQNNEINAEPISESSSVYTGMNKVFEHTRELLAILGNEEHITTADLADKVFARLDENANMNLTTVQDLIKMYVKSSNGTYKIEVGRDGGIYKGGRPVRKDPRPRCMTCNQVIRQSVNLQ